MFGVFILVGLALAALIGWLVGQPESWESRACRKRGGTMHCFVVGTMPAGQHQQVPFYDCQCLMTPPAGSAR